MHNDIPEQLDHEPRRPPPRRRGLGDRRVVLGLGAAAVLGIAGGVAMKPSLGDAPPDQPTSARTAEIPKEPEWLDIFVDRTPPPEPGFPLPPPAPKTAPDEGFTPQPISEPEPIPEPQPRAQPQPVPKPPTIVVRQPQREVPPRLAERRPTPRQQARPSFNCRYARSTSERMVCVDPRLAAADRRLAQAYNEAVASGVPERSLRRAQDQWLGVRESAARYGPEDVARAYERRIAELEQMRR